MDFRGAEDPCTGNAARHNLHEMLMIALLCVIRGIRHAPVWLFPGI